MGVGMGELKKRCPNCLDANVEIIIKSGTFKKTEAGYDECNSNKIYLHLNKAIVLYSKKKIELEDF